ncbi:MAG: ABC transporter ATP-binding protein [Pseudomonadota bacterium]|nr:ABC transporter ATP-binding protein [Pseudomonadota bacterium]
MTIPALLELRSASKHYLLGESRIDALRHVNGAIMPGEFVAIWGPSGSGKSTFCNLVGLLDAPSSGSVHFLGQDVAQLSDDERSDLRNRSIGFVFQGFNLVPVLSALENVMLPMQIGRSRARTARKVAQARLIEVGLGSHLAHRPAKLSGGQQQRVAIARALVGRPALVVADEPTANLDSDNALKIIALMRAISLNEGTAFVFSTHDERLLERVDRRIALCDGAVVEDRMVVVHPAQRGVTC